MLVCPASASSTLRIFLLLSMVTNLVLILWYANGKQLNWILSEKKLKKYGNQSNQVSIENKYGNQPNVVSTSAEKNMEGPSDRILMTEIFLEERVRSQLVESELIWKKGVEARLAAEIRSGLSPNAPWKPVHLRVIWDFFYPNFNCPHSIERLGRLGDGGKWVCGISHFAKHGTNCVVYSYGISGDSSFEQDILKRTNCTVHAYDHTVGGAVITKLFPGRAYFEKLGIGSADSGQLRTLKSEMTRKGTTFIDILKMDVEGAEVKSIPKILEDFPYQLPIGQLIIELHLGSFPQRDLYKNFKKWWEALEKAGLRAFHSEPNLLNIFGKSLPLYEFAFMNVKTDSVLLHA